MDDGSQEMNHVETKRGRRHSQPRGAERMSLLERFNELRLRCNATKRLELGLKGRKIIAQANGLGPGPKRPIRALKARDKFMTPRLFRAFSACSVFGPSTQAVGLGYDLSAFQA